MRFFARTGRGCRTMVICGTLVAFGGATETLSAQDAQDQTGARSDIVLFDQFLDAHADIDAQLRANPSLLTNAEYLEAHPQLESFLNQHPQVQAQVKQNPSMLMEREKRFDAREPQRTNPNPNPDLNRQELATADQFFDKNPNIDRDLQRNPGLVNNAEYLEAHPQLQQFLNQHPNVKEEIAENPRYFMQRENRFDAQESRRTNPNPNPDLNRQELATADQFFDKNPNIDRDLQRNPGLVNNAEYLEAHPQLQQFLNQHPNVKEEIAENPRYFMQRENRFDARESSRDHDRNFDRDRDRNADRDRDATARNDQDFDRDRARDTDRDIRRSGDVDRRNPNPDLTNREVATMDDFLDRHPDVAKSLEKKPQLVNDRGYLKRHKDLDEFLNEHPQVREEVRENPSYFMHRENQYEARNVDRDALNRDRDRDDRDRDNSARDRDASDRDRSRDFDRTTRDADNDLSKKELQDMDRFLDKHKKIEKDLQKNPSLANDNDYLKHHKSLENFLSKNPQVGEELRENPSSFMQKQERLEARNHRMNNHQPATKPKTKVEQKEQMNTATPH
jgi:hypothetical protein